MALVYYREIERLRRELAKLKGSDAPGVQLEFENMRLLLEQRTRALFGPKSEKRAHECAVPETETAPESAEPARGHGPTEQPTLPIIEEEFKLDEADKICPQCGGVLHEMVGQYEESEDVTVVSQHYRARKIRRQKYRCEHNDCIETALGPLKLQEGGRYSPEFAVEAALSKYADHTPLERQVRRMAREGLLVTSQTLWDQLQILARHLESCHEAIRKTVLASPVVGADETRWPVPGTESKTWQAWCVTGADAVYFQIAPGRGLEHAEKIFADYRGTIMADAYAVYNALSRDNPNLKVACCWAHARRKFVDVQDHYPAQCQQMLDLIGELYAVEREVRQAAQDGDEDNYRRLLATARRERSKPIIARILKWIGEQSVLPESGLGRAIGYVLNNWVGLTRFLDDAAIPLDNNATERALRGPVVGRKNFYGARSRRGTEVAALFYSLIETAKLREVNPKEYLIEAIYAALKNPGAVTIPTPKSI
jgi:transposase